MTRAAVFTLLCAASLTAGAAGSPQLHNVDSLYAPHISEDRVFFNPWNPSIPSVGKLFDAYLAENPYAKMEPPPVPVKQQAALPPVPENQASITWIGHATTVIQDNGDIVLTDPHFSDKAGIYRRQTPLGLPIEQIPAPLLAVISHNHYDHLDSASVLALPADTHWLVPMGLADWFRKQGRRKVTELDWWQSISVGDWIATCVPLQHWSRRLWQSTNSTLWCGWVLESPQRSYFFAGDTGYFHGFSEIGRRFPNIDVALLPIGSYAPREFLAYQHMDPSDAVKAFQDIGARHMIPIHWGSFAFTQEPPGEPAMELERVLNRGNAVPKGIVMLPIGGSHRIQ